MLKSIIIPIIVFIGPMLVGFCPAWSQDRSGKVTWTMIDDHLEFADSQDWRVRHTPANAEAHKFKFFAVRFHLGYFELHLIEMADFVRTYQDKIALTQHANKNLSALLSLGLRAVFDAQPFGGRTVAVAPAGFPTEVRETANYGLLKVNGTIRSQYLPDGPSAILCLDNPPPGKSFAYQIPAFFRSDEKFWSNQIEQQAFTRCRDAVQVGPRILEDPNAISKVVTKRETYKRKTNSTENCINDVEIYPGIPETAANFTPYYRTIFAVDDPGRCGEVTSRETARNGYLIVTASPISLWDAQDMLKNADFYAKDEYAPRWAINLAGGDYAGLVVARRASLTAELYTDPFEVGSVNATQSSVIVVTRRP